MKIELDRDAAIEILHLTDTHLCPGKRPDGPPTSLAEAAALLNGVTTVESLDRLIDDVADFNMDVVLHTGDVVESAGDEAYQRAFDQLQRLGRPMLVCAGNHDDPAMLAKALSARGMPLRQIDIGNWRVLVVNSYGGDHGGEVGEAELGVLFEQASAWNGPVLLGLHHPPMSVCDHPDCSLADAGELFEVLRKAGNIAGVASGHLHHAAEVEQAGVRYLLGPSTCLQLVHKHPLPDNNRSGTRGGARRIQLLPSGEIRSALCWTSWGSLTDTTG